MITIIAGSSYKEDIQREDSLPLDFGWTGTWAIVKTLGGIPAKSGGMDLSDDNQSFELRIAPDDTVIPKGEYWLVTEQTNTSIGHRNELQKRIRITEQGIV